MNQTRGQRANDNRRGGRESPRRGAQTPVLFQWECLLCSGTGCSSVAQGARDRILFRSAKAESRRGVSGCSASSVAISARALCSCPFLSEERADSRRAFCRAKVLEISALETAVLELAVPEAAVLEAAVPEAAVPEAFVRVAFEDR